MKLSTLAKTLGIFAVATQNIIPEAKAQTNFPNFTLCNSFNKTGNAVVTVYGQHGLPIALIGEEVCENIIGNQCNRISKNQTECSANTETLEGNELSGDFTLNIDGIVDAGFINNGNIYSCTEQLDKDTFVIFPATDYSCPVAPKLGR